MFRPRRSRRNRRNKGTSLARRTGTSVNRARRASGSASSTSHSQNRFYVKGYEDLKEAASFDGVTTMAEARRVLPAKWMSTRAYAEGVADALKNVARARGGDHGNDYAQRFNPFGRRPRKNKGAVKRKSVIVIWGISHGAKPYYWLTGVGSTSHHPSEASLKAAVKRYYEGYRISFRKDENGFSKVRRGSLVANRGGKKYAPRRNRKNPPRNSRGQFIKSRGR